MKHFNRRRLAVVIVVIFIAVLSFFAGRLFGHVNYIEPTGTGQHPNSDRAGIPPDSLKH
ncbi:MAG TPA: hypothetical protein VGR89_06335 [Puia sp.]|nr:hypothetical protein [Puia sp.]